MKKRAFIYIAIAAIMFVYGFSMSHYKIFPYRQLQMIQNQYQQPIDQFEVNQQDITSQETEILDTFLTRLLLKKIPIPNYIGHGGGLSLAGDWLFLITNKGSVRTYNTKEISAPELNFPDVPMDLDALTESGHLYKNNFKHRWFRVNGVYAEYDSLDSNIYLYASHNGYNLAQDCITHNLSRLQIDADSDTLNSQDAWKTIFTAEPCIDPEPDYILADTYYPGHISGGDIVSFDDQRLLVTVGDYNRHGIDGTDEYAMDINITYGKHLLIDKFTGEWSVYAIGNRNPSGVYIDRDGVIWSVENGPEAGDELNIIIDGGNYGWPKVSYGMWYDPQFGLPGDQKYGSHANYRKPVFSWIPSVAPSSITKIESDKFELWKGDLIMGTMGDQSLHRLRLDENNNVTYNERIHFGHRIRDLQTLNDGKLVSLTDDGFLIFIDDGGASYTEETISQTSISSLNELDKFIVQTDSAQIIANRQTAKVIFEQNCASCHNLNSDSQIGPHLNNLFNREVGSADDFNYSQTLKNDTRTWNQSLLKSFLENPEDGFSGNRMQQIGLTSAETDSIIQYLESMNR